MNFLQNLLEPERLLLLWQALDPSTRRASGERYVVGEVREEGGRLNLIYFDNAETAKAKEQGFTGMTAFPVAEKTYFEDVGEVLMKRLPPTTRPDYLDYLRSYRLPPERASELTLMQLLAYTGGMLAGDGFSFACALDNATPPFDFTFTIAGFRHYAGIQVQPITALLNQQVILTPEPSNQHDPHAIAVYRNEELFGYVPKGLTTELLQKVINHYQFDATICRINGTPTDPNVMVMARVAKD